MPNRKDPFGSMQGFVNQFRGAMQNPQQMIMNKLGVPQNYYNDPNGAVQWLMNNGRMDQQTFNKLKGMADQITNNPMFQQMMGGNSNGR